MSLFGKIYITTGGYTYYLQANGTGSPVVMSTTNPDYNLKITSTNNSIGWKILNIYPNDSNGIRDGGTSSYYLQINNSNQQTDGLASYLVDSIQSKTSCPTQQSLSCISSDKTPCTNNPGCFYLQRTGKSGNGNVNILSYFNDDLYQLCWNSSEGNSSNPEFFVSDNITEDLSNTYVCSFNIIYKNV